MIKPLLFVLDDDPALCRLIQILLKAHHFETVIFHDPKELLKKLHKGGVEPAAIISDINMPGMDGLSLREALLREERFRRLPFLFLTSRRAVRDKVQGLETGADAYLTKPIVPEELIATLKNILKRAGDHRALLEIDPLTQSYNRSYLERRLPALLAANRHKSSISCAMIDIDHFKKINDRYGHPTGDLILRGVTEIIRQHIRAADILIRYGGEEFLLVLIGQGATAAFTAVDRIRKIIAAKIFVDATGQGQLRATISSGLSRITPNRTLAQAIQEADRRLYDAKAQGRNQTVKALSCARVHS